MRGKTQSLRAKRKLLDRLDSGNDAEENFAHFGQESFIIKRNLRRECPEQWLATARRVGELKSDTRKARTSTLVSFISVPAGEVLNVPCFSCL